MSTTTSARVTILGVALAWRPISGDPEVGISSGGEPIRDSVVRLHNFRYTQLDVPSTVEHTHVEHKTLEDTQWAIDE